MNILIIGAGNGGAAAAVELSLAGHDVTLYARSDAALEPFRSRGIGYTGVFGEGRVKLSRLTTDIASGMRDANAAVICLPTFAHQSVARTLIGAGWPSDRPVILNPGHTGGAFEVETIFLAEGKAPPIVEFSTLAYVARKPQPDVVNITGRAKSLRAAALPRGKEHLELACNLFPGAYDCGDVIASDLSNVNMIVHPPGAMLGASWVETTGGDFTFYVQGMTPGVIGVMAGLDEERRAVARAFGHELPTIIGEMRAIGTVPQGALDDDYSAIASGDANRKIKAPGNLEHRYYTEDFAHGLVPFLAYAQVAGVPAPTALALVVLHAKMTAHLPKPALRDARSMGIEAMTIGEIRRRAGAG